MKHGFDLEAGTPVTPAPKYWNRILVPPNTTGTSNWLLGVNAVAIDTQPITYARGEIKFNRHK